GIPSRGVDDGAAARDGKRPPVEECPDWPWAGFAPQSCMRKSDLVQVPPLPPLRISTLSGLQLIHGALQRPAENVVPGFLFLCRLLIPPGRFGALHQAIHGGGPAPAAIRPQ